MNADTYQNKNITPIVDSNTSDEMVIAKGNNTYQQHPFLIVAGSLLALLVFVAITGPSGGQYLKSSTPDDMAQGTGALAGYEVDTAIAAHSLDIFGLNDVSENEGGCTPAGGDVFDNGLKKRLECCSGLVEVKTWCIAEGAGDQYYGERICYKCTVPSYYKEKYRM